MTQDSFTHPNSEARERAVQFLYQSECERLFHFSDSHFSQFIENFKIAPKVAQISRGMVEGCFPVAVFQGNQRLIGFHKSL